jgi:hypothetical protein
VLENQARRRGREAEGGGLLKRETSSFQWFPVITNRLHFLIFAHFARGLAESLNNFWRQFGRQPSLASGPIPGSDRFKRTFVSALSMSALCQQPTS